MTNQKTVFHVCFSPISWKNPRSISELAEKVSGGIDHRSVMAAVNWNRRHVQGPCRRENGPYAYVNTRVLATEDGGRTYRALTIMEEMEIWQ